MAGKTPVYDRTIEPLCDSASAIVGITCTAKNITDMKSRERTNAGANGTLPSKW
jgi:hypothetical protein